MDGGQINLTPELEQALAKFRAEREPLLKARTERVKKFIDEMPGTYFSAEYREKWSTASVTVENLDGTLARFYKLVTDRIMTLVGGATEELIENMIVMRERIRALEKALAEHKATGPNLADAFRGSWQPGSVYVRGSLAVHDGSLWLSLADTEQRPGSDAAWRLVTKRGANGKDLR